MMKGVKVKSQRTFLLNIVSLQDKKDFILNLKELLSEISLNLICCDCGFSIS